MKLKTSILQLLEICWWTIIVSILLSVAGPVNQIHHVVITQTRPFMERNVITQSSTNQIHSTEIPQTSNMQVYHTFLLLHVQGSGSKASSVLIYIDHVFLTG